MNTKQLMKKLKYNFPVSCFKHHNKIKIVSRVAVIKSQMRDGITINSTGESEHENR
jgi:hypothetical protein